MTKPTYIALCGLPGSGKDTVAGMISSLAKSVIIDDGLPLRLAAPTLFGFNPSYPFSHEGKAKMVLMSDGETYRSVRDCLGTLGAMIESEFGEFAIPARAVDLAEQVGRNEEADFFIFSSVRRRQGVYYKQHGGFVVEVHRHSSQDSDHFLFDTDYNRDCVDYHLYNNGTFEDLLDDVRELLFRIVMDKSRRLP